VRVLGLLPALLALTACSLGGSGDDSVSARQTQRAATAVAEDAIPVVARVLGAHQVEAHAEWSECLQGLAWKYHGGVAVHAPGGHVKARLRAVEAALLDAGFTESLTSESQVSVARDGISFTIYRPSQTAQRVWAAFVESGCSGYSDEDQSVIEHDRGNDFPGLAS